MKTREKIIPGGEVILHKSEDGSLAIDVKLQEEIVWLTPVQMTKLFDKARPTILEHIKNVYDEQELNRESTCRKFRQVQFEGNRKIIRQIDYYNLGVIISVGYRVKSKHGTQFRIWANKVLIELLLRRRLWSSYNEVMKIVFGQANKLLFPSPSPSERAEVRLCALNFT